MTPTRLQATWWHADHPDSGAIAELAPDDARSVRLAGALTRLGVERGDCVAWQLPNGDDAVALLWACWRIGAVAVPLHHRATDAEVGAMLGALPVRLVVEPDRVARLAEEGEPWRGAAPAARDLALVLHTSGSSGTPKAVLHTQGTLAHKARTMAAVHGLGRDDAVLMPAPLAHMAGILAGVTTPAAAGMRTAFMAQWDPDEALSIIEAERVSFMVGPPTFFHGLLDAAGDRPERLASLRLVSAGGAGVTEAFCADASTRLGARVKRTYGSTEAPSVTTSAADDDPALGWTTDGRAVPGAAVRLGPDGEVQVRGPELFVGYADPSRTTAAITEDGWYRSGDLGELHDGWLRITGRSSDVIIRGGENLTPSEMEGHLEAHPAVAAAVVVGEPDERLGERACAFVTLAPGAGAGFDLDECARWFSSRGVARLRTPERVVVLDVLPVLASGKADRAELTRRAAR